jgi:anti-sigma B factor antagonist
MDDQDHPGRAKGGPPLVAMPAEIDVNNAGQVGTELDCWLFQPGSDLIIADLTTTTFCDSCGVRALFQAHSRAAAEGIELRLAASPAVQRIFSLTGLDQVVSIYPSLAAALAATAARSTRGSADVPE